MARANGITRQQILGVLKQRGSLTADDLHQELGISQVAVRQHLASLEAEQMVAITIERRGLGRPSHRYSLTAQGDEAFPRYYETLSKEVLEAMREWQGDRAVEELMARITQRQVAQLGDRFQGLEARDAVAELAQYQTENGYMAEVSEESPENGTHDTLLLIQHNCAVCSVAREYPQFVCEQERQMLSKALGCAEVIRERHILNGDTNCTYRIRIRQSSPDQKEN